MNHANNQPFSGFMPVPNMVPGMHQQQYFNMQGPSPFLPPGFGFPTSIPHLPESRNIPGINPFCSPGFSAGAANFAPPLISPYQVNHCLPQNPWSWQLAGHFPHPAWTSPPPCYQQALAQQQVRFMSLLCGNNPYNPNLEISSPRNAVQYPGMLGYEARGGQHQPAKFREMTPESSTPYNSWEQAQMMAMYGCAPPYASPAFCIRYPSVGQNVSNHSEHKHSLTNIQGRGVHNSQDHRADSSKSFIQEEGNTAFGVSNGIRDYSTFINTSVQNNIFETNPPVPFYRGPWAQQNKHFTDVESGFGNLSGSRQFADQGYVGNPTQPRDRGPGPTEHAGDASTTAVEENKFYGIGTNDCQKYCLDIAEGTAGPPKIHEAVSDETQPTAPTTSTNPEIFASKCSLTQEVSAAEMFLNEGTEERMSDTHATSASKSANFYRSELSSATTIVLRRNQPSHHQMPVKCKITFGKRIGVSQKRRVLGRARSGFRRKRRRHPLRKRKQAKVKVTWDLKSQGKRGRPRKYPFPPVKKVTEETATSSTHPVHALITPKSTPESLGTPSVPCCPIDFPQNGDDRPEEALSHCNHVAESSPIVGSNLTLKDQVFDGANIVRFAKLSEILQYNLSSDQAEGTVTTCGSVEASSSEDNTEKSLWKKRSLMEQVGLHPRNIHVNQEPSMECTPENHTEDFKNEPRFDTNHRRTSEAPKPVTPRQDAKIIENSEPFRRSPRQSKSSETEVMNTQTYQAALPVKTRRGKQISQNRRQKERVTSSTSASEHELVRIPERTLRLRARQSAIELAATRKWKLKWDGPLFPRIPLTAAEKKLEKTSVAKMQVWVLHDELGETYLHRAAREGERDVVLYCLKFDGFHPRCTNKRGFTPLHEACKGGSVEVAKLLLDYGAYHSQPARGNIRPLHVASKEGNLELVRLLMSLGADPYLLTVGGTNCFDLAESHPAVAQYLRDYAKEHGPHTTSDS